MALSKLTISKPETNPKGRWRPGQSGNPSGNPRKHDGIPVAELARCYTRDALHALVLALHNPRERVPAAVALLDRGWGKPQQNIKTESDINVLHLIAAQAISQTLQLEQPERPVIEAQAPGDDAPTE